MEMMEELMPGVKLEFIRQLSGTDESPAYGQQVVISYACRCPTTNAPYFTVDSAKVRLGDSDVSPGVELALRRMKCGEKAVVHCENRFAFGSTGRTALKDSDERDVPQDTDVDFEVEILSLGTTAPCAAMPPFDCLEECDEKRKNGNIHFRSHNLPKAAQFYGAAIKAVSELLSAFEKGTNEHDRVLRLMIDCGNNLGACHLKLGDFKKCEEACIAVLHLDLQNVKGLYRGGVASMMQDKFEEAGLAFKRALEVDPENKEVQREMRRLKARIRDYKQKESKMLKTMSAKLFRTKTDEDGSGPNKGTAVATDARYKSNDVVNPAAASSVKVPSQSQDTKNGGNPSLQSPTLPLKHKATPWSTWGVLCLLVVSPVIAGLWWAQLQ